MFGRVALLFFTFSFILHHIASETCDRDEAEAIRQDPTRKCRKSCSSDTDCKSGNKTCTCDNLCGKSCFNQDAECPPLDPPVNGAVKTPDGMIYNKRAKYSCKDGSKMNGTDVRKCRSDRKWSLSEPTCVRTCPSPVKPGYAFPIFRSSTFYVPGTKLLYSCRTSHLGADRNVTCQDDYQWSPLEIMCVKRTCGFPGTLNNGFYEGTDFSYSETVTFKCKKGHYMVGGNLGVEHTRRCRLEGWDAGLGGVSCEPVSCGYPDDLENGDLDKRYAKGNVYTGQIIYSCNIGYKLVGPERGKCNENGTWGERPICEIDVSCSFTKSTASTCGYKITDGDLRRDHTFNGVGGSSNYVLLGTGELQSVFYPIGNETKCLKFDYKTSSASALFVEVVAEDGDQVEMPAAKNTGGWHQYETKIRSLDGDEENVRWDIVIKLYASIDNIRLLDGEECRTHLPPHPDCTTQSAPFFIQHHHICNSGYTDKTT